MNLTHGRPANLENDPKFINVNNAKEQPSETAAYLQTTPKRQQNFEPNIFTPSKKQKFSDNLNSWWQTVNPESSDLAGALDELRHRNARNKGPGGSC